MGSTTTTVVDGNKTSVRCELRYKEYEINNLLAKKILTRATVELVKVLKDKRLNAVLLGIFKAQEILQDLESECLEELDITTTEWAIRFFKLLGQRYDTCQALQLLCNLDDDRLNNYQLQIRDAFQKGPNNPDVKVVAIEVLGVK
ncbi:hypothetical protein Ocin01_10025 [Orchesella cincta]|uniref:Uncharacterized protein n=1 Tax=Orchesella cincta TaxID=48709 RepID=A0A1D2MVE2_ORCCI|nr:hypothetical protein Ocin01_10025 [Orchesella cincta]